MNRITLTFALSVFTLALPAATTQAADYRHIDELATSVERQANQLQREFRAGYTFYPQYRHLVADANDLRAKASHIHDLVHDGANPQHLLADVQDLTRDVHHLEELLTEVENTRFIRTPGWTPCNTTRARQIIEALDDNVHHLSEDIAALQPRRRGPVSTYPQPVPGRGGNPNGGYGPGYGSRPQGPRYGTNPGYGRPGYGRRTTDRGVEFRAGGVSVQFRD